MIPPIMALDAAGVNPALYALPIIFTASCAFLLPLDTVSLVTCRRGCYRMFDMLPPGLVISAVRVVLMTAADRDRSAGGVAVAAVQVVAAARRTHGSSGPGALPS